MSHGKLKILDLFSGIGGFSLGLERTGGFETTAFCEIDPYCRAVLAKHWPGVPIFDDVRELRAEHVGPVDVITGGFPCQDVSIAGRRAGLGENSRSGLWSEIIRLASEVRPRFIVVENVTNLLSGPRERPGGWFNRVLCDLAAIRYDAEWNCIRACRFGLPHPRDRIWIVAYPDGLHAPELVRAGSLSGKFGRAWTINGSYEPKRETNQPELVGVADGIPDRAHRVKALGNSIVPQIPQMIGEAILMAEKLEG